MWPVGDVHTTVPSEIILGYRLFFGLDTAARDKPLGHFPEGDGLHGPLSPNTRIVEGAGTRYHQSELSWWLSGITTRGRISTGSLGISRGWGSTSPGCRSTSPGWGSTV